MGVVHRERGEPRLEQMAGRAGAGVDERGEAPMRFPHRPRQRVGVGGDQNELNVVGHQAIGPAGDPVGAAALGEKIAIEGVIARLGEQRLPAIAALRHVMGQAGNGDAGETRHQASISGAILCNAYHVPKFPNSKFPAGGLRRRRHPGRREAAPAAP